MSSPVVDTRTSPELSCADQTNLAFAELIPGDHFVLLADHDPTPLRYMLNAERRGQFTWTPLQEGPDLWKVWVGRTDEGAIHD